MPRIHSLREVSVVLGPVNAIRHPFMHDKREEQLGIAIGPTETLGHPFRIVTEVPLRREVGKHTVYAFGTKWLYSELAIVPDEDVEAVIVWDPGWLRTGTGEGAIDELRKVWELAHGWGAPVVGLYSDWFAAWKVEAGIIGTKASTMYMDALIVDPAGAEALRQSIHPLSITNPLDQRYRPIAEVESFLTYGRLPRIGGGELAEMKPLHERSVDVAMVSTLHPQHVVLRPYYVKAMREACRDLGLTFEFKNSLKAEEMEELYLDTKVVFNVSLGSQPNCRVHEALACGCVLLTDSWNIGLGDVPCLRYESASHLRERLAMFKHYSPAHWQEHQDAALRWAQEHTPDKTWTEVIDTALDLVDMTTDARIARTAFAEGFRRAAN